MFIETNETAIRLSAFLGVFIIMAVLEYAFPRRPRLMLRGGRWLTNLGLVILNSVALRLVVPFAAVEAAVTAQEHEWGVLLLIELPFWLEAAIAIIIFDLLIYVQHVLMHKVPFLWRLHKVHHADRDLDVTSGVRFHPVEIIVSMLYKILCVILLGAPVVAVISFEVILNAGSLFNHANFRLSLSVDKWLRRFIITPDFHRVHHSLKMRETNSNYGFFLTIWDFVFKTYTAEPAGGHEGMTIGLSEHQDDSPKNILWCLIAPFKKSKNI
jgi:sterol desaturase/sphingolipid hydroxylase (fatty acid hydroxylase superfamily)